MRPTCIRRNTSECLYDKPEVTCNSSIKLYKIIQKKGIKDLESKVSINVIVIIVDVIIIFVAIV